MRKRLIIAALTSVGAFLIPAGTALASNSNVQSVKDCSTCQFKPAIPTTTTIKNSSSSSSTHIRIVSAIRVKVSTYEKVHHVVVTINQRPGGVASYKGCVDPIQRGWIGNGGQFSNTRYKGGQGRFWDNWHAGRLICNPHRIKWNGGYWMDGTKDNCGNEHIRIQVSGPRTIHKIIPVVTFRTQKQFLKTYDKWVNTATTSTSTGTTTTSFSCDSYGSGWTLTTERGSPECKLCPSTPCPTPPPPPSKAHAWLNKTAIKDGSTVALSGGEFTFSITVNGMSSSSTTNAASGSNRDLGQFNPGDSVQVCETNTGGYTPDQLCISHTMTAGENFTFSFTNRKTSPPPPPPPPPPSHWTSVTCTGFEEISGNGSFLVDCQVADDNGAPIFLSVASDSNSEISGINCLSNGGSQTCPSGGTFEFRVKGINDGSTVLYSTITVTATANGVPSKPPFTQTYQVDPSGGGF